MRGYENLLPGQRPALDRVAGSTGSNVDQSVQANGERTRQVFTATMEAPNVQTIPPLGVAYLGQPLSLIVPGVTGSDYGDSEPVGNSFAWWSAHFDYAAGNSSGAVHAGFTTLVDPTEAPFPGTPLRLHRVTQGTNVAGPVTWQPVRFDTMHAWAAIPGEHSVQLAFLNNDAAAVVWIRNLFMEVGVF